MNKRAYRGLWAVFAVGGLLAAILPTLGCAGIKQNQGPGAGGSSSATGGTIGIGGSFGTGGMVVTPVTCNGQCTDFEPTANNPNPIFSNVTPDVTGMFGTPSGSGPCVTEPEDGALFPNNWLPPRVHVPGYSSSGLLKITFHADMESTDLVAYSMGDSWPLPKNVWQGLAAHIVGQPVTVTVQTPGGGVTTVHFQVAPVGAGGSMVFWSADPAVVNQQSNGSDPSTVVNDSYLLGFSVGDNSTVQALNILQVTQQTGTQGGMTQPSHCIGCHVGTPDGNYVAYIDAWPWSAVFAGISPSNTGQSLTNNDYSGATCTSWNTCTSGTRNFMQYPWGGGMAFSPAHWPADGMMGERIAIMATQLPKSDLVAPWNTDDYYAGNLVWIDTQSTSITMNNGQPWPTEGVAFDYLQHTGDLGGVAFPTWSNDGNTIVYASTAPTPSIKQPSNNMPISGDQDGRLSQGMTDLYQVPYNNKAGGTATPVPGASSPQYEEYYPAFSPDGNMIAFTAAPAGQTMYANSQAELYVVPFGPSDAAPKRLAANDPPTCSGMQSPGINNHWPKWAPDVEPGSDGNTYYWIIFSSNRYGTPPVTTSVNGVKTTVQVSQLYITAVVKTELETLTYPAIYLYNQPPTRLNTTPAWQDFHIPIVIDKP